MRATIACPLFAFNFLPEDGQAAVRRSSYFEGLCSLLKKFRLTSVVAAKGFSGEDDGRSLVDTLGVGLSVTL
jgi:hypothetical protein